MIKSTAIAKARTKAGGPSAKASLPALVSEALPAYLQNAQNDEQDNFDSSDVSIPMIKLLQGLSPECESFPEAVSGQFWHTGADMSLGTDFRFVVARRRKKYLLMAPILDGQGVLARSDDARVWSQLGSWNVQIDKKTKVVWTIDDLDVERSGLTKWGTSDPNDPDSPPAATLVYEYLVLLPDYLELGPVVMSLARSAIRRARRGLNDKIQLQFNNGRPLQALVFQAKSYKDNSPQGDFSNWSFTSSGFSSEVLYKQAKEVASLLDVYVISGEAEVLGEKDTASPDQSKMDF